MPTALRRKPPTPSAAVVLPETTDPEEPDPTLARVRPRYAYGYDVYGNHVSITDPKGRVTTFTYDELGRQLSRTLPQVAGDPTVRTETKTYDDRGRVETEIDFLGQKTEFIYAAAAADPQGRLASTNFYAAGSATPDETWTYAYDAYDAYDAQNLPPAATREPGRPIPMSPTLTTNWAGWRPSLGSCVTALTYPPILT